MSQLESVVTVETPEQVSLSYTVAGVGSRIEAAIIDGLLIFALIAGVWILVFLLGFLSVMAGFDIFPSIAPSAGGWVLAIVVLLQFGITWGYYVLFEGLRDGQTPGKKRRGLRVVQDGGYSVSFSASAIRNLARLLDMQPFPFSAIAIFSMIFSKSGKRVGDLMAGTFVVKESSNVALNHVAVPQVAGGPTLALLNDDEYALLEKYVTRRQDLPPDRRTSVAAQLEARFRSKAPTSEPMNPAKYLMWLFAQERQARASLVASASNNGSTAEMHALASFGVTRWNEFSDWIARVRKTGLRKMPAEQVSEFVSRYREVSADLARLKTASRGRDLTHTFFVGRLVAAGHNIIYSGKQHTLSSIGKYFAHTLPAEVRHSFGAIMLSSAIFFAPAVASYVTVLNRPEVASEVLPLEMLERARTASERQAQGKGYVTVEDSERPLMASSIIANNVMVTYAVFIFGITAGVGTVLMLLFNGVSIGGAVGLFTAEGVYDVLLAFVAPHGVLELSAIVLAGGAGLLIASAILLPGNLTRRDALILKGRRAIRLIGLTTIMLVAAGLIEGLISPLVWPLEHKLAVSVLTAILLIAYFAAGWRRLRPESYNPDRDFISR